MNSEIATSAAKKSQRYDVPPKQGLYDPQFEHDACGVGFVVNIKGKKSQEIIRQPNSSCPSSRMTRSITP